MTGRIFAGADDPRPEVAFSFAGQPVVARDGDTVAMALWAAGVAVLRHSSKAAQPRSVLCNMGICYECLVTIDGAAVRACTTLVRPGMVVMPGGKP